VRENKDGDLFVWHIGDVNGAMNVVTRLAPIYLPCCDVEALARAVVAEFDGQGIPPEDYGYPVKWVSVPPRGFSWGENQPPYHYRSMVMKRFLKHFDCSEAIFV
jgi:hypothetical protein